MVYIFRHCYFFAFPSLSFSTHRGRRRKLGFTLLAIEKRFERNSKPVTTVATIAKGMKSTERAGRQKGREKRYRGASFRSITYFHLAPFLNFVRREGEEADPRLCKKVCSLEMACEAFPTRGSNRGYV